MLFDFPGHIRLQILAQAPPLASTFGLGHRQMRTLSARPVDYDLSVLPVHNTLIEMPSVCLNCLRTPHLRTFFSIFVCFGGIL